MTLWCIGRRRGTTCSHGVPEARSQAPQDCGARVRCPYLVVAGQEDELSPIEYTEKLIAEMSAPRELLLYQGERHGLHAGPASALGPDDQAYVADWLADRLQGRPMPPSRRVRVYVDVTGRQAETPLQRVRPARVIRGRHPTASRTDRFPRH